MRRALIVGGTGLVGRATARHLVARGWQVVVTGRDPAHQPPDLTAEGVEFAAVDRGDQDALRATLGGGADLVVDCICFTAAHARIVLPLLADAQSTVMISTKAVYVDAAGRHSNSATMPHFDAPIRESQPTMAPGDGDYNRPAGYGANKVAAEQVLLNSDFPVTVVRPSKIHGEGALKPNEWVFVKRVLDRRPAVLLARQGAGGDQTSAAANIAALIETVADRPGRRILNGADPDAPTAREIADVVAHHLDHEWQQVLLTDTDDPTLGRHPWDRIPPVVLDTSAAADLGYRPVGDFASTVAAEIDWLVGAAAAHRLPDGFDHEWFEPMFDYAAEDRYLAGLTRRRLR